MSGLALTIQEVQQASLTILKKIDVICRKENIKYYVAYGTLIGAIRHQGFIPWDDDLDIQMPRADYNRFICYFDNHAEELFPFTALYDSLSRRLPFLITRISDMTYKMVGEFGQGVNQLGAFVDVYPLDGLGCNLDEAERKLIFMRKTSLNYLRCSNPAYNRIGTPGKKILKRLYSITRGSSQLQENKFRKAIQSCDFEKSDYVSSCVWDWDLKSINRKDDYGDVQYVKFEDILVPVPNNFDIILRKQYGNYMQLPTREERTAHHCYQLVHRAGLTD